MSHFDPKRFDDRYQNALLELIKAKGEHRAPKLEPAPKPSNVVSLMDALRKSIADEKETGPKGRKAAAPAAKAEKPPAKEAAAEKPATEKPAAKKAAARSTARRTPAKDGARLKRAG